MIPTILLTGFLGAGKTTLLNRLIDHYNSYRTVLLINEFGKVGIDGERLNEGNYEKIELNRGSLFCICVRTDFIAEVEKIATQLKPDLLIIEATGLANTSEMEKMLALPNLKSHIQLETCICLVDCTTFLKIKDNLKAPVSQLESADLILINKTDLVTDEQKSQVRKAVSSHVSRTPIIETQYADFPLETLNALHHRSTYSPGEPGEGRPDPVFSLTLESDNHFNEAGWTRFKEFIQPHIMRLKGFVEIDTDTRYVDATMDGWTETVLQKNTSPSIRLVIIGQTLDNDLIEKRFKELVMNG
jgi:G3E family GTPase